MLSKPHIAAIGSGSPSALNHTIAIVCNFPYVEESYGLASRSCLFPVISRCTPDTSKKKCKISVIIEERLLGSLEST